MHRLVPMLMVVVFGAIPFTAAGRLDLPYLWAVLAVQFVVMSWAATKMDRDLIRERLRPGAGGVDRRLRLYASPFMIAQLVVGGLDAGRFHWTGDMSPTVHSLGVLLAATGAGLAAWAFSVNRFFSPVVRIQSERGHQLVDAGPYGWVRHPGYLGTLLGMPGWSMAIGSWWSLAPAAGVAVLILRRAWIEDRYLHENLPGYQEYSQRVRARLLPGVW